MKHLGLLLTERCNAHCRHCIISHFVSEGRDMALTDAQRYINEFAEITIPGSPFTVHFSGGEVFLRFTDLLTVTRHAKEKGASSVVCVTNGAWGEKPELARQQAKELKSARMNRVNFSLDDFHQEYIPLGSVVNSISACLEAGLDIGIKCTVTRNSQKLHNNIANLKDLLLNIPFQAEEWAYVPSLNDKQIPKQEWLIPKSLPQEHCPELILTILPDGTAFPCCGAGWTPRLILGNARSESIASLIQKAQYGHVFGVMRDKGPAFFIPYFNQSEESLPTEGYVSTCHLCMTVLNHSACDKILPTALADWKIERIKNALGGLWNPNITVSIPSKG